MGSQISITNIEEFDQIVNNLDTCLKSINQSFDDEKKVVKIVLDNPQSWSGKARDNANDKYNELYSIYPSVSESLKNYVDFLKNVSMRHKEYEASLISNLEEKNEELNVN